MPTSLAGRAVLPWLARRPQASLARNACLLAHLHAATREHTAQALATRQTVSIDDSTRGLLSRSFSSSPRSSQEGETHRYYFATPPPTPPPSATPRRHLLRTRWFWVSGVLFMLFGTATGGMMRDTFYPAKLLETGSPEEIKVREALRSQILKDPFVKLLRENPDNWTNHEAYASIPEASRSGRLTTGPLGSAECIGAYQQIFHLRPRDGATTPPNDTAQQPPPGKMASDVIDVVYFGRATTGWPTVVHGGLIATLLDEHSARAAASDPSLRARGLGVLTASLDIKYVRPVRSNRLYAVHAAAVPEEQLEPAERGKRDRKIWVVVTLADLKGETCVSGKALFVIPRNGKLRAIPDDF